jgi:hypothetical protein
MIKNIQNTIKYLLVIGLLGWPLSASAEPSCVVEPFTTQVYQGQVAALSVALHTDDPIAPFEINLGSLPDAIESGFLKKEDIQTLGKIIIVPLVVQTKQDAQVGSFMISIAYKTSQTKQTVCQFNLEVRKKTMTGNTQPLASSQALVKTFSSGVLPSENTASSTQTSSQSFLFSKTLALTSRGAQVKLLQEILKSLGFFPQNQDTTEYFGKITEQAVKDFQKNKNIEPLGLVGPKTKKALNELSQ